MSGSLQGLSAGTEANTLWKRFLFGCRYRRCLGSSFGQGPWSLVAATGCGTFRPATLGCDDGDPSSRRMQTRPGRAHPLWGWFGARRRSRRYWLYGGQQASWAERPVDWRVGGRPHRAPWSRHPHPSILVTSKCPGRGARIAGFASGRTPGCAGLGRDLRGTTGGVTDVCRPRTFGSE